MAVVLPDARVLNATIDLPGRLEAYSRAPIFARVSGYLKSWNADIGAKVRAGQVIAEIEAPDLDQQLLQARADLASAQSAAQKNSKLRDIHLTNSISPVRRCSEMLCDPLNFCYRVTFYPFVDPHPRCPTRISTGRPSGVWMTRS
mgnify:CR=1 FL=1